MEQLIQNTPINPGIEAYSRPRLDFEIDLIKDVRNLLVNAGLLNKVEAVYDTNRFIQNALHANAEVQRFALNRFWNLQLMQCSAQSTQERFCLISNGSVTDWFTLFREKVLPFIIANELPR